MDDCCSYKSSELERLARRQGQRRILITVLALNAVMFFVEFGAGVIAGSAALMADAVDMFGDALVYGVSLYALSRGDVWKARAALVKGGFIFVFGVSVLIQIVAKITTGVPPAAPLMVGFGALALMVNVTCLSLLWRYREQDVNMSSTFECSRNDVIANVGVIAAAGLVSLTMSPWPDIVIAGLIAAVFLRSAVRVTLQAWPEVRKAYTRSAM